MDRSLFESKVNDMFIKKPKLFCFGFDERASNKMIEEVEKYYNVRMCKEYKEFLELYGGGYFGFVVIFSCDHNSKFYIKSNVLKDWVSEKLFLPVVDLETGDFFGFEIMDGKCQNTISLYSHEEDMIYELEMDFYEILLKYGLKYNFE